MVDFAVLGIKILFQDNLYMLWSTYVLCIQQSVQKAINPHTFIIIRFEKQGMIKCKCIMPNEYIKGMFRSTPLLKSVSQKMYLMLSNISWSSLR